jgi:hypothetical protein
MASYVFKMIVDCRRIAVVAVAFGFLGHANAQAGNPYGGYKSAYSSGHSYTKQSYSYGGSNKSCQGTYTSRSYGYSYSGTKKYSTNHSKPYGGYSKPSRYGY